MSLLRWTGRMLLRAGRAFRWMLLLLLVFAIPMNYVVQYTNRNDFCNSCHIMDPYYASWHRGTHAGVDCVQCHYPPDIEGKLWTKYQGLAQVASYVTDTASTRPSGHVADASCLRSGCHSEEDLGAVTFNNIHFDHRLHLDPKRPSDKLRCTTCHAQITMETHMGLDTQPCMLCHLQERTGGAEIGSCQGCHTLPDVVVEHEGMNFDHATVENRAIDCESCHASVTVGAAEVDRGRCLSCHGREEELKVLAEALADPEERDRLHESHVSGHAVECRSCHMEMSHGQPPPDHKSMARDSCSGCHASQHAPQAAFLRGVGGFGVDETPSLMGRIHLSCESCHSDLSAGQPEVACQHCHGPGTVGMVRSWTSWLDSGRTGLRADLATLRAELGDTAKAEWLTLLAEAEGNIALVEKAGGAHNFLFAQRLHEAARERIEGVTRRANLSVELSPFKRPHDGEGGECRICHLDAEPDRPFFGYPFVHATHVNKADLSCDVCHGGEERHGSLSIDQSFCIECHHNEDEDCSRCHTDVAQMMRGDGIVGLNDLPSPKNDQAPCIACHTETGPDADHVANSRVMCVECHEEDKYGPMQDAWLAEEQTLLAQLAERLMTLEVRLAEAPRNREGWPGQGKKLREARVRLADLRRSRFVHNPDRARQIGAAIVAAADEVAEFLDLQR